MKNKNKNINWIIKITIAAFIISLILSIISNETITKFNTIIGTIILITFIIIGIIFDVIGIAITSADEKPFHSMSAKKINGAKMAVVLKKNAHKTSSFCNDVIGDICGIISGSAGLVVADSISKQFNYDTTTTIIIITSIIAALTIGGKAACKEIAIKNSTNILYTFSKTISIFYHPKQK